ncbi:MAG: hypothetical protein OK454_11675, partial [Thaumarchaeota archaeon]|nr:hypothetical protein [Nitrososphaerota archaeon]
AGAWLARWQEEDEGLEAIKRGIDVAIAECDEMDNLLTLYSVELSVSHITKKKNNTKYRPLVRPLDYSLTN